MEYITNNDRTFLEDLLNLRDTSDYYPNPDYYYNPNNLIWTASAVDSCPDFPIANSDPPYTPSFDDYSALLSDQTPLVYAALSPSEFAVDSSGVNLEGGQTVQNYNYYGEGNGDPNAGNGAPTCKVEPLPEMPGAFDVGFCPEAAPATRKSKVKKVSGQPSKNLMAERRRRKRLNDRLSMLRSVVPKISKMDRTSILGDTIDYMKELLERINTLQEDMQLGSDQLSLMSIFKDVKPNELLVRNSPKFEVERRKEETRIEICCGGKPGLLLSTVTTLEALGLDFNHCVISCFNDFALQASCSEELKKRVMLDSEDIKQALIRNAGYGGKCV